MFQLKDAVGEAAIECRERSFIDRAVASWSANPKLVILGNPSARRLSIVSFLVRHGELYLHHNFVVALLNDLFGIQARGGCSCAGPYGHRLLGIDLERSSRFREAIESGCEGVKPGWVRINFNYFISEEAFEFILEAVHLIAQDGWKLLPLYEFEPETGLWRHRDRSRVAAGLGLDDVSYASGLDAVPVAPHHGAGDGGRELPGGGAPDRRRRRARAGTGRPARGRWSRGSRAAVVRASR